MNIIQAILNLFFGGNKKQEVKELDKQIKVKDSEVKELEKEVKVLESKKRVNKKEVAKLKRKFIYMRYFIYILLMGALFSQEVVDEPKTYTFTEEEVLGFTNEIKELQLKDSLNVSLVMDLEEQIKLYEENSFIDSMLISNKTTQINLLKDTNKLLEQKVKLVRPKWYENKWLYFTYGVLMTATSVKLAGQIVD